ncbi:MAG: hypothetical protein ACP5HU_08125 [Phycisphaerae bacterium]
MQLSLRENICRKQELPADDEIIRGRIELLSPPEKELLEAVLIRGQSAASLARIMGIPPRTLRDRVRRLSRRLTSRPFLDAARALPYLPAEDAELARLYFCQGLSQRTLARRLGLTSHKLRRRLDRVSAQISAIRRMHRSRSFARGA